jgi:hypothetical protein
MRWVFFGEGVSYQPSRALDASEPSLGKTMEYISVSSTNISAIGYDEISQTLCVRFNNLAEYHYFGVPQEVYDGLRIAASVGQFFDQNVKKAGYSYSQVA